MNKTDTIITAISAIGLAFGAALLIAEYIINGGTAPL